jgi:ribosome-interacting GTPase 1
MEDQKIQVSQRKPDIQIQRKDQTSISVPKDGKLFTRPQD